MSFPSPMAAPMPTGAMGDALIGMCVLGSAAGRVGSKQQGAARAHKGEALETRGREGACERVSAGGGRRAGREARDREETEMAESFAVCGAVPLHSGNQPPFRISSDQRMN